MGHAGSWVWHVASIAPAYWSAEMHRIHGRDPASGHPTSDEYQSLLGSDAWALWLAHLEKSIQDHTEVNFEYVVNRMGGSAKRVLVVGRPIKGAANRITEFIGSATEVTGDPDEKRKLDAPDENPLH